MATLDVVRLMPWGGHRNLALREALRLAPGEVGAVANDLAIQLVVDDEERAAALEEELRPYVTCVGEGCARHPQLHRYRRDDGRWVTWLEPDHECEQATRR